MSNCQKIIDIKLCKILTGAICMCIIYKKHTKGENYGFSKNFW